VFPPLLAIFFVAERVGASSGEMRNVRALPLLDCRASLLLCDFSLCLLRVSVGGLMLREEVRGKGVAWWGFNSGGAERRRRRRRSS
jgi:hypothetical protein